MVNIALAVLALLIGGALLPYVLRLCSHLLERVPILGAVAALGVLYVLQPTLADGGQGERSEPPAMVAPIAHSVAWEDDQERQAQTSDDEMVDAYNAERHRFQQEVDEATAKIKALIGI